MPPQIKTISEADLETPIKTISMSDVEGEIKSTAKAPPRAEVDQRRLNATPYQQRESNAREFSLGMVEGTGVSPEGVVETVGDVKSVATNPSSLPLMAYKLAKGLGRSVWEIGKVLADPANPDGRSALLAEAIGKGLISGPVEMYEGYKEGDSDKMAHGAGSTLTGFVPAAYGAGSALNAGAKGAKAAILPEMTQEGRINALMQNMKSAVKNKGIAPQTIAEDVQPRLKQAYQEFGIDPKDIPDKNLAPGTDVIGDQVRGGTVEQLARVNKVLEAEHAADIAAGKLPKGSKFVPEKYVTIAAADRAVDIAHRAIGQAVDTFKNVPVSKAKAAIVAELRAMAGKERIPNPKLSKAYQRIAEQIEATKDTVGDINALKVQFNKAPSKVFSGTPSQQIAADVNPLIAQTDAAALIREHLYPAIEDVALNNGIPMEGRLIEAGRREANAIITRDGIYNEWSAVAGNHVPWSLKNYFKYVTGGSVPVLGNPLDRPATARTVGRIITGPEHPMRDFNKNLRDGLGTLEGFVPETVNITPSKTQYLNMKAIRRNADKVAKQNIFDRKQQQAAAIDRNIHYFQPPKSINGVPSDLFPIEVGSRRTVNYTLEDGTPVRGADVYRDRMGKPVTINKLPLIETEATAASGDLFAGGRFGDQGSLHYPPVQTSTGIGEDAVRAQQRAGSLDRVLVGTPETGVTSLRPEEPPQRGGQVTAEFVDDNGRPLRNTPPPGMEWNGDRWVRKDRTIGGIPAGQRQIPQRASTDVTATVSGPTVGPSGTRRATTKVNPDQIAAPKPITDKGRQIAKKAEVPKKPIITKPPTQPKAKSKPYMVTDPQGGSHFFETKAQANEFSKRIGTKAEVKAAPAVSDNGSLRSDADIDKRIKEIAEAQKEYDSFLKSIGMTEDQFDKLSKVEKAKLRLGKKK